MTQPTEAQADIVERLLDEADLCQNEGAEDIATLLSEAAAEITRLRAQLAEPQLWQPTETAPKDGSYILVRLVVIDDERWAHLSGRAFVVRHEGITQNGYDLGWALHPGFGGVPDQWIDAWRAIDPTTLTAGEDVHHG